MKNNRNIYSIGAYILLGCIVLCISYQTYAPAEGVRLEDSSKIANTVIQKTISLNFVGDILAARAVETAMRTYGYEYPFQKIVDRLSEADITFANLETPLIGTATSGKTTIGGSTVFRGDIAFAYALQKAGIDIVSIANNHMKDQGEKGIVSTVSTLDTAGVKHVGAGKNLDDARKLEIIETQGVKVGYLAYNDADVVPISYHATKTQSGTNIMNIENLKVDIAQARSRVDILVISMHSGTEYVTAKPNTRQTDFAHAAIDAGADIVVGHHPHVLQPIEIYNGKYIVYSLGNFIFDQPWPDTKESALLHMYVTVSKSSIQKDETWHIDRYAHAVTPLMIQNFQPQETEDGAKQKRILDRLFVPAYMLTIGTEKIFVEIASTTEKRVKGLSNRNSLPKETGLLFVFDHPGALGIWMKDMFFPIDIYWFDKDFKLVDKRLSVEVATYPNVFFPKKESLYVLETPVGLLRDMSLTDNLTGELTLVQ